MRRPLKEPRIPLDVLLGTLGGGAALGALAVFAVGLFDVSARDGHWPGVPWLLHTAYERSVDLRAPPAAVVPPLEDDDLAALGARHFELACSQCHAAPGRARDATVRAMLPAPPHVGEAISGWEPRHLYWILKNGVKMSGMPHWPSTVRDDDVWSVVAFLERVPGMDAGGYAALLGTPDGSLAEGLDENALADAATLDDEAIARSVSAAAADIGAPHVDARTLAVCALCHGRDGASGDNRHIPRLDLQTPDYLAASLAAYREDRRFSGIMQHAASTLDDRTIRALARHYGGRDASVEVTTGTPDARADARTPGTAAPGAAANGPAPSAAGADDDPDRAAALARGEALARGTAAPATVRDVPVCAACHGPWPESLPARYPVIAGQHEGFLLAQLRAWKAGTRGGTDLARMMHEVAPALEDADLAALAAWYASLGPEAARGGTRGETSGVGASVDDGEGAVAPPRR